MKALWGAEAGRRRRWGVGLFFAGLLLLGLALVRDYGFSIDELQDRKTGMVSLKYVSQLVHPAFIEHHADFANYGEVLAEYPDRDYGVAYQLPVSWLEQILNLPGWREAYWLRHLCTFLVSLAGVGALYQLARRRFHDWRLGLLGATLLVLSPRLFAESFYNDKDLVFLALFAIATNTTVAFVRRPTWRGALGHALACALAIDARIMGVLLPVATLGLLGLQAAHGAYRGGHRRLWAQVLAWAALLPVLVVALWPYLWAAPWSNFTQAFVNMSRFRWDGIVLYRGELTSALHLPWHYAPTWIGITTPPLYLAGFGLGVVLIIRQLLRRGWRLYATAEEWQDLLFLSLAGAPVAAVICLHSVLYDGWRQLYFIYPALLLVALRGLVAVGRWWPTAGAWGRRWPRLGYGLLGLSLLGTAGQMAAMHPLQNTYFNALAGPNVETRYDVDYWLLSYNQGLRWILAHDDRPTIRVSAQQPPILEANRWLLSNADQSRLRVVDEPQQADYFLTTYRYHPQAYPEYPVEAHALRADGRRVLSIFRVK